MSVTIGDLVAKHNEILAFLEAEDEKHAAATRPYRDAINVIKGACLASLQEQGQQNAKTEAGTAYQQTSMSVKVDNRDEFLKFVADNHLDFLDAGALKEPVT